MMATTLAENFIVVLGLPESARDKLDNDKDILGGISFRFMFDDTTGIIKVVPSAVHDVTTEKLKDEIHDASLAMDVPKLQMLYYHAYGNSQ